MSLKARTYITVIAAAGLSLLVWQVANWSSSSFARYASFFAVGMFSSVLKVPLPGVTGTLSPNFIFIIFGALELTLPETLLMACGITAVQCLWHAFRKPRTIAVQLLFNTGSISISSGAGYAAYHLLPAQQLDWTVRLAAAIIVYFFANTGSVAMINSLTEHRPLRKVWTECYFWSLPYYLVGAAIAALMSIANNYLGWQTALLVIPLVYLIYRSYGLYLGRLEDEKKHAEEMAALHLRTIEALALAIEAKDHTTHDHLARVQVYAIEIGKELGLTSDELEALRAASLLHDIGKLGVPEHIISKPGKLTPEEFEKMKIHPVIGAEILERVAFPYPVAPIVRSHHERWDGAGYPDGLKGEAIPVGARILAAIDCLDALASDRQYRRALPLDEAMREVAKMGGRSFDPRVVEVLGRRYRELEATARSCQIDLVLSTGIKITNGDAPAAGFEQTDGAPRNGEPKVDFLHSIAAARHEVQALFELAQDLGKSLNLDETLSVLAARLRRIIPCDTMAIYIKRDQMLIPEYVTGDEFRLFTSLEIPIGQGLSGWVAENCRPIVNGNPSVEPGYLNDPTKFSKLRSALSVPLEGLNGVLGVLTLYRSEADAFTRDHLRILQAVSSKVALSIENALKYRQAEESATIDYLTQLPNARSLFLHLDAELSRARRSAVPVAVLVCDIDNFRHINDRYGQLEGNKILRNIGHALKDACREYDYIARMGGDEFVLVLPGLSPDSVLSRCERFREAVADAVREVCANEMLTISIGQAFFPEDGSDAEQLLSEADRRMYWEKRQNKMRVAATRIAWDEFRPASVQ